MPEPSGPAATSARGRYLYVGMADALRSRIKERTVQPGELLPGEHSLAVEFGVSRSVVRQALRTLADENLIHIVPGRGAIVAQPEWHRNALETAGLSQQMRAMGTRVSTQVLTYRVERAGQQHAERLGSTDVLHLERVRLLDDVPVAFIRTWLPAWVADKIPRSALVDESLHQQLLERAGVVVRGGPREVRAVSVGGAMATQLDIPGGAPVLQLAGETLDQHGRPVEIFSTWHRSDRIALDIGAPAPTGSAGSPASGVDSARLAELERAAEELLAQVRGLRSS